MQALPLKQVKGSHENGNVEKSCWEKVVVNLGKDFTLFESTVD